MSLRTSTAADTTRERIVAAAVALLSEGGREAVSTRAVSAAAGVQAPTIYRLFGDKHGLLDAVATHGFAAYLASKRELEPSVDPVDDLRRGWDLHLGFGLANPALYALMYGEPHPGASSPAGLTAAGLLAGMIRRIAEAGRLRVREEHAAQLLHAAAVGITLTLLSLPEEGRDPAVSHLAREAVIAAIITDAPVLATPGPAGAAIALRAVLPQTSALSTRERGLLEDWLERIARCDGATG